MLRRLVAVLMSGAVVAAVSLAVDLPTANAGTGAVSISGTNFRIDGALPYANTPAEGMLLNARMSNAIFDDENPTTVGKWAYPDTGTWSAERNVTEFVAAVPSYAAKGLRAFTINLQGSNPVPGCSCDATHDWITTAYTSSGSLKSAWTSRADRVIRAASANGMVVILGLMYHGQDQRLADEAAVLRAVDNVTDWVVGNGYSNVLIEIANEGNHSLTSHSIVRNRVHDLIKRVQDRSAGALKVSTGFTGGFIPLDAVIRQADYVILHGNGTSTSGLAGMVSSVKATAGYQAKPKPILFTEDGTATTRMTAAVEAGASWGYHDPGVNDYVTGFQRPPVNWTINTATKKSFFDHVSTYVTDPTPSPSPSPSSSVPPNDSRSLVVSTSASRTAPQPLDGRTVGGKIYVFTTPDTGVSKVSFHVDDPAMSKPPYRVESGAPFDLAGGTATTATAFATTALPDGAHTVTAAFTLTNGSSAVVTATMVVKNAAVPTPPPPSGEYRVLISTSASRSSPQPLDGRAVTGGIYVFTGPDSGATSVAFYVDDPGRTRAPYRTEGNAPFDLAGGDLATAKPYDTRVLSVGTHTITAVITLTAGGATTTTATMTVAR